jgi:arylsulfatase
MMIRLPAGKPQRSYAPGKFYATDAITDHALDFLGAMRKDSAPWFLYVAYQAAHFPVQSRPEDMAGYPALYAQGWDKIRDERLARQKSIGLLSEGTSLTPRSLIPKPVISKRAGSMTGDGNNPPWDSLPADRRADLAQRMSVYAGMITGMDRNIGRIVADLRASGQLDNTLLFFLSDNGACAEWEPFGFEMQPVAEPQPGTGLNQGTQALPNKLYQADELQHMGGPGSRPSYGSGWANACNTPWRMYKHYDHEGGISTPLVVHWPAGFSARGAFRSEVGHIIDLMATCVDVSSAKYPADFDAHRILPMEGMSLAPAFADQPLKREYLAWEHEGNRAIREGHWKLVSLAGAPWELYDMDTDRVELNNLAPREPERVKEMSARWDAWAARTHVLPRPGEAKKVGVD